MKAILVAVVASIAGVGAASAQTAGAAPNLEPSSSVDAAGSATPATGVETTTSGAADANAPTPVPTTTTTTSEGMTTTTTGGTAMPAGSAAASDATAGDAATTGGTDATAMPATDSASSAASADMADMTAQDFVTKAASGGMFEVQSSEMALDRSTSDDVKQFAQMMIDDHTKANDELMSLAADKDLDVPSEPEGEPADHMKAVTDAQDAEFDTTYVEHQIKAHEATIELFQAEAGNSNDADLAAFAEKTLPTLKTHLEAAQKLQTN